MKNSKNKNQGLFESFGIFYIKRFLNKINTSKNFPSDEFLNKESAAINLRGILLSGIIGFVCVIPSVWVSIHFNDEKWYILYGYLALVTILFTAIEFYSLFLISLKTVSDLAHLVNINAIKKDHLFNGPFSIINILSRTALEIGEPEMTFFGIDPFKSVSKKNLFVLGIFYQIKIIITNFILKYTLLFAIGEKIFGFSILYVALLVEFFWNSVVIHKVLKEARLRLFGFVLANKITNELRENGILITLSETAKIACLRAIGNAVVMTKNYHPNMIILLLEFQEIFEIKEPKELDNWDLFLNDLSLLDDKERNFVLDLLTVSIAFDGKISDLEAGSIKQAYKEYTDIYMKRLFHLKNSLIEGKLNEAYSLCQLDFKAG